MFSTKVVDVAEVARAFEKNAAEALWMKEDKPKEGSKWRTGVGYINNKFKTESTKDAQNILIYGRDMLITRGPPNMDDPNDKGLEYISESNKQERRIEVSGEHSGGLGKIVKLFNVERDRQITDLCEKKLLGSDWKKKFVPMFKTHTSDSDTIKEEYRNKQYKDKDGNVDFRFDVVLDFSRYGEGPKIPADKRGKPITTIKDFRTGRLNEKTNLVEYELATVDGKIIDEMNVHKFITFGSTIEEYMVSLHSTSKSAQGTSTKRLAIELVVMPNTQERVIERKDNSDLIKKIQAAREKNNPKPEATKEEKPPKSEEKSEEKKSEEKPVESPKEEKKEPTKEDLEKQKATGNFLESIGTKKD